MNWDVTDVTVQNDTALRVRFRDGLEGEVDLAHDAIDEAIAAHGKWVLD